MTSGVKMFFLATCDSARNHWILRMAPSPSWASGIPPILWLAAVFCLGLPAIAPAQSPATATQAVAEQSPSDAANRWEADIQKLEKQAAPERANLFVGSSSIRMWKLSTSFPKHPCVNRGFGGSQLSDAVHYADRIVIPARPRVVLLYAGDNDLSAKKSPETIRDDYRKFRDKIRKALPETKIVVISVKPSPKRWELREQALKTNRLLRDEVLAGGNECFVDVWTPMIGPDGMPRPELYVKDHLHMTEAGYQIWNGLIEPHLVGE